MAAHPVSSAGPLHSLAEAGPGDLVEVVYILFGSLRQSYEAAGIRAGTRLHVRRRDEAGRLVVELPCGALAAVDAPFVEVRPLAAPGWSPAAPALRPVTVTPLPDRAPAREPAPNPKTA